jgi:hypothetical protein
MTHFPDRLVTVTSGGAAMVMTVGENREKLEASVFKEAAHESICSRQLPKTCEVVVVCLAHGQVVGGVAQGCAASQKLLGGGMLQLEEEQEQPTFHLPSFPPAEAPVKRPPSALAPGRFSRNKLFLANTIRTDIRDTTPSMYLGLRSSAIQNRSMSLDHVDLLNQPSG